MRRIIVQSLKIDMFDDEVFVFTPKGTDHLPARRAPRPSILPMPSIPAWATPWWAPRSTTASPTIDTAAEKRRYCGGADLQIRQGPQPGLADHLQEQSGPHQDQAVVQEGEAGRKTSSTARPSFEAELRRMGAAPHHRQRPRAAGAASEKAVLRQPGTICTPPSATAD